MTTAYGDPLTERQSEVHRFMLGHQDEHGMPPSVREVMAAMGYASPNAALGHFRAMLRKGWVRKQGIGPTRSRSKFFAVDLAKPDACPCCGNPVAKRRPA